MTYVYDAVMDVSFLSRKFTLVITEHAQQRMRLRNISLEMVLEIVEGGQVLKKEDENRYWVYKVFAKRADNTVCLSVVVEHPNLVVITALVNWRPNL